MEVSSHILQARVYIFGACKNDFCAFVKLSVLKLVIGGSAFLEPVLIMFVLVVLVCLGLFYCVDWFFFLFPFSSCWVSLEIWSSIPSTIFHCSCFVKIHEFPSVSPEMLFTQ